jgi:periplasmic protein TonB
MQDPLGSFSGSNSGSEPTDSWLNRVRENLAQLLLPSRLKPSSANGAPIHLLKFDKSLRPARAQGASLLTHAAIFAVIVFLITRSHPYPGPFPSLKDATPLSHYTFPIIRTVSNANASPGRGGSGDHNPVPPTVGNLPPHSPIQLVRPTLPQNQDHLLPEPPTILDPNAPNVLPPTARIGLPWMSADTDSPGPGDGHGIGTGKHGVLGDGDDGDVGYGQGGPYGPGFIPPTCAYCPYPTYTDDARHGKVQGTVTLRVLVGADGRAQDVRVIKSVGFGLDERAIDTVRNWKFVAARDSSKHTVAAWVTIEAQFRLF